MKFKRVPIQEIILDVSQRLENLENDVKRLKCQVAQQEVKQ